MLEKTYISAVPLENLREWDKNYRSITPQALAHLKNKITEIGVFKPLLAIRGTASGTYQIIGGNQRLRAYRELGHKTADIIFTKHLNDFFVFERTFFKIRKLHTAGTKGRRRCLTK